MDDLLAEFLTETNEALDVTDVQLVKLEQEPDNPDILSNIFRLVHTIKGTSGFLGLPRLESVAHAGEDVLGKIRDGEIAVLPDVVTLVLEAVDRIKEIVVGLGELETEPEGDDSDLIARLRETAANAGKPAAAVEAPAEAEPISEMDALEAAFAAAPGPEDESGESENDEADAEPVMAAEPVDVAPDSEAPKKFAAKPVAKAEKSGDGAVGNQTIRVSVDLLETLMTTVSELVLTRNQLMQLLRVREGSDSDFTVPLQRLSHVTTDLQEGVMKTRMQPIGNAWAKLPRIVRDLANDLGKKIELEMVGAETELDRQVLELIKDPLTHMVRNSGDHGLESTAERVAAGKSETGKIRLNAFHEGGHIIMQISDDGGGIDIGRVREKALANGIATEQDLAGQTEQQILQYIFKAGFSTAKAVTSVSGRGVGLDVVRTNVEKIGGTVDAKSVDGQGTTFTVKIPLTLAIVSALIVGCAGERFAMPQISVVELVRASKESEHKIEVINATPVLRLRNRLLPLVDLRTILKLDGVLDTARELPVVAAAEKAEQDDSGTSDADGGDGNRELSTITNKAPDTEDAFILVTQVGSYRFGIVVDRVFDTEEIVVKPVAPILRHIGVFSGNTILGDGSVIMILDPNGIAAVTGEVPMPEADEAAAELQRGQKTGDSVSLLVFHAGGAEPKAVPLSLIARLEEIDVASVEHANGRHVVQYRGKLMPLVTVNDEFEVKTEGRQPVLVFSDHDRSMGLIVDEIVDIVEEQLSVELESDDPELLGSAIIGGKATGIIDTAHYLTKAYGDWFERRGSASAGTVAHGQRVLLVDDSPFFRNLITPLLTTAGYLVVTAEDAEAALALREAGEGFDVIVSDIEMPGMSGFEFATEVKNDSRWQNVPMIAVSSFTGSGDLSKGHEVGFTDYIAKNDRDAILSGISDTLAAIGERS